MAEKGTRKRSVLLFDGDRSAIYGSSGNRYITRAAGRQTGWLAGWLVGRVEASCVSFENLISLIKVLAWRGTSPPFPYPPLPSCPGCGPWPRSTFFPESLVSLG